MSTPIVSTTWDAKSVAEFRLTEEDLKEALETLPKDQKDALTQAGTAHP